MAVEVEELYSNLNKLLEDICKFLSDEVNYEKLSPNSRKQANELISRSKVQLQEIANIGIDNSGYDGAYVNMDRKSEYNEDDKNCIYSSVDETIVSNPPIIHHIQNPYANLPAKELLQDIKYGCLSWKCKIILRFEKIRRIYAGVHNNWFLVYSSEKDNKPLQSFNLQFHKAQNVSLRQNKNVSQDFELICTSGEKKSYYFIALTHKDMLQWISHINRCHDTLNNPRKTSLLEDQVSETYDLIDNHNLQENSEDDDKETFYHDIESFSSNRQIQDFNKPPDLPVRKTTKSNTPLPPLPKTEIDEESTSSLRSSQSTTYDQVNPPALSDTSSFSEDDEDNIYEPFVSKISEINNQQNNMQNNNARSSVTNKIKLLDKEKPKMPLKPKILIEKPKYLSEVKK